MKLQKILCSPLLSTLRFPGEFIERKKYYEIVESVLGKRYEQILEGRDERLKKEYGEMFQSALKESANCKKISTLAYNFEYNPKCGLFSLKLVDDKFGDSVISGGISDLRDESAKGNIRGVQVYGERCKESTPEHLFTRTLSGKIWLRKGKRKEDETLVLEGTYAPIGDLEGLWRLESHPLGQIIR